MVHVFKASRNVEVERMKYLEQLVQPLVPNVLVLVQRKQVLVLDLELLK